MTTNQLELFLAANSPSQEIPHRDRSALPPSHRGDAVGNIKKSLKQVFVSNHNRNM